ncbi:MAG TPA: SDR family oxidoreductase [Nitrospira sp.]
MKPVVLVTGAAGLIGHYVIRTAVQWAPSWEVRGLTRADLDLTDCNKVERALRSIKPHAVVHCAALSRTKDCEQDPKKARLINVDVTAHLAELSQDIPFIFLSSGEVFDGNSGWYREMDEPNPINVYGKTKLQAERIVLRNPGHTALRIVLTAGTSQNGLRSFVEDMCRAAASNREVTLFEDEYRCPLPAGVIARAIWALLDRGKPGLYHLGGSERLSRWEIGQALLPWYPELEGRLVKRFARNYQGAPRPRDLSLCCDKIQDLISFRIPGFRTWLAERSARGSDPWDYLEKAS